MTVQGMAAHAAADPTRVALVLDGEVRTYGALDERAARLAAALRSWGVAPGEPVAVMLPNSFELFEAAFATAKAQALYLPVNWHLKASEVAWILADSGAKVLVAEASLAGQVEEALGDAPACRVVWVGDGAAGEGDRYEDVLATAPAGGASHPDGVEPWPAPNFLFYTSGTTGRPKGVLHGLADGERLAASMAGIAQMWGFTPDDVYALAGPAYHAGPGGYAFTSLFAGSRVVIMPKWDARRFLELVDQERISTAFLTPAHFIRILEVPEDERKGYDLSSLRLVLHAGAPCPTPVKRRIMEALPHAAIWEFYGMSEGPATRISPEDWQARPGSVGQPWPGIEVRILDADGRRLSPGEQGVIYVTAPTSRFRYHNDPDKTESAWRDDAFTVGDIGYLDDDGWLYLTDRATDMVIRDGVNIYPREVEEVLFQHPAVVDCAVFGVPDERRGEQLKAMVEVREPVTPADLQAHCRERLADFKCPELVEVVDSLPRDPNGKVLKRRLREAHWEGRASAI